MFYEYEGEEDQHSENCNFIYGNCDCIMSDPDISENDRIAQLLSNTMSKTTTITFKPDQNDFAKRYARMLKDQAFYKKMEGKQK